jgi:hypothetical protein
VHSCGKMWDCMTSKMSPIPACRAQRLRLIRGGGLKESKAFLDCAAPDCRADDYVRCMTLFNAWDACSPAGL